MRLQTTLSQVGRDHRSEMVHPTPNGLVGHGYTTFGQQIFDVAQAERKPEVEPNRLLKDLGREPVTRVADFLHPLGYRPASGTASATLRDNADFLHPLRLLGHQTA